MPKQVTQVLLQLDAGPASDAEEVEILTQQVRRELSELPIESIDLISNGAALDGTKAFGVVELGKLVVEIASGGVLKSVIDVVKVWLTRDEKRSITLEIGGDKLQLTGISSSQQERLAEAFLQRHSTY